MLGVIAKYIQDVSVLRRLMFAVMFLPPELPDLWNVAIQFATCGKINSKNSMTEEQTKALMENLQELNATAFDSDRILFKHIIAFEIAGKPLGVPLISSNNVCLQCMGELTLRKDRFAAVVIYDDTTGTIPGSHFHKYCRNQSCSFVQYYGYYSQNSKVSYNQGWIDLPYFVSSRETVFSIELLKQMDAEILIGEVSFQQRADIYNYIHHDENFQSPR